MVTSVFSRCKARIVSETRANGNSTLFRYDGDGGKDQTIRELRVGQTEGKDVQLGWGKSQRIGNKWRVRHRGRKRESGVNSFRGPSGTPTANYMFAAIICRREANRGLPQGNTIQPRKGQAT